MELEKLNKSQIVLLTLLVSFVTSIATGIVTVSLMEQAPPAVTQTVNRIVERTIERVAPAGEVAAAAVGAGGEMIVIRESELVARAVAAAEPSIVRLYTPGRDDAGNTIELFAGFGIVLNEQGVLLADAATPEGPLTALRSDGIRVPAMVLERTSGAKFIRLQAAATTQREGRDEPITWRAARFASVSPSLGQAVVAMGGTTATKIGGGIITGISEIGDTQKQRIFETDIAIDSFAAGSPLLTADGIVGIATRETRSNGATFLASSAIVLDNTSSEGGNAAQNQ
ncbi:MAG TPA: hypothetical protein VNM40_00270 [Candidatus Paceibacterota bacterium]|nr:hypothetical protein [Candidatus Paceibacterota bacterium]